MKKDEMLDLLLEFVSETEGAIEQAYGDLMDLENDPANNETIRSFKRRIHSLKGGSFLIGLNKTGHLFHVLEEVLQHIESGKYDLSGKLIETCYGVLDAVRKNCLEIREQKKLIEEGYESLQVSIESFLTQQQGGGAQKAEVPQPTPPKEKLELPKEKPEPVRPKKIEPNIAKEVKEPQTTEEPPATIKRDADKYEVVDESMLELVLGYIEESEDRLERAYNILLEIDNGERNSENFKVLKREVHSLKGAAYMVGLPESGGILHKFEDILNAIESQKINWSNELIDLFYKVIDTVKDITQKIKDSHKIKEKAPKELSDQLTKYLNSPEKGIPSKGEPSPKATPQKAPLTEPKITKVSQVQVVTPIEKTVIETPIEKKQDLEKKQVVDQPKPAAPVVPLNIPTTAKNLTKKAANVIQTLRVDINKVDKNMNLVTELVVNKIRFDEKLRNLLTLMNKVERSIRYLSELSTQDDERLNYDVLEHKIASRFFEMSIADNVQNPVKVLEEDILRILSDYKRNISREGLHSSFSEIKSVANVLKDITILTEEYSQDLINTTDTIGMVTTGLQENLMQIRMLPISTLVTKFKRMVRDIARETGKDIDFVISGEHTELDKNVIEELGDPLMHTLRNCIDHGIEKTEDRIASNKPEKGLVHLKASYEGNQVVIEISDDGRGIQLEKIRASAVKKGLCTPEQISTMNDAEIRQLIFAPGFSTAAKVTEISGRGVGMDVVKENINKLKGIVEIDSEPGKGTIFKIRLPLTLAVLQALLVKLGEQIFAIPLSFVDKTITLFSSDIRRVGKNSVINILGKTIPLKSLPEIIGLESSFKGGNDTPRIAILTRYSNVQYAFLIDDLIGRQEIVIKTLGDYLKNIPDVTGSTILGDGNVILILDILSILNKTVTSDGGIGMMGEVEKLGVTDEELEALLNIPVKSTQPAPVNNLEKSSGPDINQGQTILVVDDSATVRRAIVRALKLAGYHTIEAKNGEDALAIASKQNIDLFSIDIEMPRMNGYCLTEELRKIPKYKKTPICMVTSRASAVDKEKGLKAGADEYISKPFDTTDLVKFVMKRLG